MNLRPYIAFLLSIGLSGQLSGQVIEGLVLQTDRKTTIPYVNIRIGGTAIGTVSQFDGRFKLDVSERPKTKDTLIFSAIGYENKVIPITAEMDTIYVTLTPTSVGLDAVLVSPKNPEELIAAAAENIPENYAKEAFNGTLYQRQMIRLNGKYLESSEAILRARVAPIVNSMSDTTSIKMLAFKHFDEESQAIKTIISKKRKNKPDKMAIEGMDSVMISLSREISENFDIYTQVDSNYIRQLYMKGPQTDKTKFWFENIIQREGRQLINIGFKGRVGGIANQQGQILMDYESLAIESFIIQLRTSSFKLRMLLKLVGINFNGADVVFKFNSIMTEEGWIPDLMSADVFVDMEKIKLFSPNIPIRIEINTQTRYLDIDIPATDDCKGKGVVKRNTALKDQFESDTNNPLWNEYDQKIRSLE
ncbi:MAG: carboxypeptidase-like regulatory domain-containing protein [Vicingaceae bacterium]